MKIDEYYVWAKSYKSRANAMLDEINNDSIFPIIGNNAKTGEPAPNKQQTERWASEPLELEDGRWCVPRVPADMLDRHGVPQSKRDEMLDTHKPNIEHVDNLQFKQIEYLQE